MTQLDGQCDRPVASVNYQLEFRCAIDWRRRQVARPLAVATEVGVGLPIYRLRSCHRRRQQELSVNSHSRESLLRRPLAYGIQRFPFTPLILWVRLIQMGVV